MSTKPKSNYWRTTYGAQAGPPGMQPGSRRMSMRGAITIVAVGVALALALMIWGCSPDQSWLVPFADEHADASEDYANKVDKYLSDPDTRNDPLVHRAVIAGAHAQARGARGQADAIAGRPPISEPDDNSPADPNTP